MRERDVLINASPIVRLVTHLDVSREQLADVVSLAGVFAALRSRVCRNEFWCSGPVATLVST
jgi:threonine aldolase